MSLEHFALLQTINSEFAQRVALEEIRAARRAKERRALLTQRLEANGMPCPIRNMAATNVLLSHAPGGICQSCHSREFRNHHGRHVCSYCRSAA